MTFLSLRPSEPVKDRRAEMEWLAKEATPYAGDWVALDGSRLVAHGPTLAAVGEAASEQAWKILCLRTCLRMIFR